MPRSTPPHQRIKHLARLAPACAVTLATTAACTSQSFRGASADPDETLFDLLTFPNQNDPQQLVDDALNEFNPDRRARGLSGIAQQPFAADPVFVTLYRGGLSDDDAAVRAAAARSLATHGEPDDAIQLADVLADDSDRLVRWHAARALQRLHHTRAVPALIDAINENTEPEAIVRAEAATALAQYPQPRVLDALIAALDDTDFAVTHAAATALNTLTGEQLGDRPENWVAFIRSTPTPFAQRQTFNYPAYQREPKWFEVINPFDDVPEEISTTPAGMPPVANR